MDDDIEFLDSDIEPFAPYTEVWFKKDVRLLRHPMGYIRLVDVGIKLVKGELVAHWPSPPLAIELDDYNF